MSTRGEEEKSNIVDSRTEDCEKCKVGDMSDWPRAAKFTNLEVEMLDFPWLHRCMVACTATTWPII